MIKGETRYRESRNVYAGFVVESSPLRSVVRVDCGEFATRKAAQRAASQAAAEYYNRKQDGHIYWVK